LKDYLKKEGEYEQYVSMIGKDDWCVNYDQQTRMCKIYDTRPDFCVVKPEKMREMFEIEEEEINDFCAFCCREHIGDVYGEDSKEMDRFEQVIEALELEDQDDELEEEDEEEAEEE